MQVKIEKLTCYRCRDEQGYYQWVPRVPDPRRCPRCSSARFDQKREAKKEEAGG